MITPRPATAADVAHYYPDIKSSFRAWACDIDGELAGIIGVTLTVPAFLFSVFDERLRPHLKSMTILRLIKWVGEVVRRCECPVVAIAEPTEPTAPYILQRLGLRYYDTVDGQELYRWSPA